MKNLKYQISITATPEKVWKTMINPVTYGEWVSPSWPDSYYEGEWKEGENIRFIGRDGSGTLGRVEEQKTYEYSFIKHIAILISGGVEDRESEMAKGWIGTTERYWFAGKNETTELKVEIVTQPDWESMFNQGWPAALQKLKEMCEKK